MLGHEAFIIEEFEIVDRHTIRFIGRVMEYEIKAGDSLIYVVHRKEGNIYTEFVAKKFIAYRHEFDVMYPGMTCLIEAESNFVDKKDFIDFKAGDRLYFKSGFKE